VRLKTMEDEQKKDWFRGFLMGYIAALFGIILGNIICKCI
jgi:hypothetical protein